MIARITTIANHNGDDHSSRSVDPVDKHVGAEVRRRRILANMSQEKLGEHLGLTFQQVQKYEKGVNRMSASRLYQVARVFGIKVAALYEGLEQPDEAPVSPAAIEARAVLASMESNDGIELLRAFAEVPSPRHRCAVVNLARSLAAPSIAVGAAE